MIHTSIDHGIGIWTFEFPPCNEIGESFLSNLEDELDHAYALHKSNQLKVLILKSGLESGFSAGADLRTLFKKHDEFVHNEWISQVQIFIKRIHAALCRLDEAPFITIGALHGVCFGGGFEIALACDILVADDTLRLAFPELRLGIIPGFGGIPRLRREVGNAAVRDLLFTGRSINALKAKDLGLVSQVVANGKAAVVAQSMATQIAKSPEYVIATTKAFTKVYPLEELEQEQRVFMEMIAQPHVISALKRFYESKDIRPYLA